MNMDISKPSAEELLIVIERLKAEKKAIELQFVAVREEVTGLRRELEEKNKTLEENNKELDEKNKALAEKNNLVMFDTLTNAHSARYGEEALCRINNVAYRDNLKAIELGRPERSYISIIQIDIDHFKDVNTNLGHAGGDAALIGLVETINNAFRDDDIIFRTQTPLVGDIGKDKPKEESILFRDGGEEFLIISKIVANSREEANQNAAVFAERIRQIIAKKTFTYQSEEDKKAGKKPVEFKLSISAGVDVRVPLSTVPMPGDAESFKRTTPFYKQMREVADKLLYWAKENGRGAVVYENKEGRPVIKGREHLVLTDPFAPVVKKFSLSDLAGNAFEVLNRMVMSFGVLRPHGKPDPTHHARLDRR